jgi:D-alanine--D-alanine ligase
VRVTVIGGGVSNEHDVSLRSAAAVATALRGAHDVDELTILRDGTWSDARGPLSMPDAVALLQAADVVFPALHGAGGEDGAIQGFLATMSVPFVGCGVEASAVCMRKDLTKQVLAAHGFEVSEGLVVFDEDAAKDAFDRLGGPVVVKPLADGSSVGVSVARTPEEAAIAVGGRTMLIERYAAGTEVDVAVAELDGRRLVGTPLEIERAPGGVFDAGQKYGGAPPFVIPARLAPRTREAVEQASLAVFDALGCAGLARVDWFVDGDRLVCNEVNTMPGMTSASQVPRMFADAGVPFEDLLDGLVRTAVR